MSVTIRSGDQTTKDPDATEKFRMDWGTERLASGVGIASSTWTVTGPDTVLTTASPVIEAGLRTTSVMLAAGTLNGRYTVKNRITTNETPAQTMDGSFTLRIEQR